MTAALKLIPAASELLALAGAGHELLTNRNKEGLPKAVAERFFRFLQAKPC